jgi:hypothetical protein
MSEQKYGFQGRLSQALNDYQGKATFDAIDERLNF